MKINIYPNTSIADLNKIKSAINGEYEITFFNCGINVIVYVNKFLLG